MITFAARKSIDMTKNASRYYLYTAVGCLALVIGFVCYYMFSGVSKSDKTEYLYIDNDDTADSVFVKLKDFSHTHGITGLSTLVRHSGYAEHIRPGRYAIAPGEGALTVFRRLKNGMQTPLNLTIPEVRTMERLAGLLGKKLMLDSAEIAEALRDTDFCRQYGYDTATVAALFIPETYEIYWNVSMENLMKRMQKEHERFWNDERIQLAAKMNMTPVEVATLDSIIDEETANDSEKPMIAGMYYNRLTLRNDEYPEGMPLQADPTVKFALKDFGLRRIYHKQLVFDSPYNTYINTGLPPGPIKIASIAGIDAVLKHVEHDYLYMCAKEDFSGTHNFARTYSEHLKNAAKYSKALNERGIK